MLGLHLDPQFALASGGSRDGSRLPSIAIIFANEIKKNRECRFGFVDQILQKFSSADAHKKRASGHASPCVFVRASAFFENEFC